jgi:diadenosine tetraphosphate (Ap4A) HIT family hydrolase
MDRNTTCPICAWVPENADTPLIYETPLWRAVLAPNQCLPGRCIIHLKRHCGDLAEMTPDEISEWLEVVRAMETALRRAFNSTMFNWSCYMNLSYREALPDPHIHWWAVPRYNHPVRIGDMIFLDEHFGSPYDHGVWMEVPQEVRQLIVDQLRTAIISVNLI